MPILDPAVDTAAPAVADPTVETPPSTTATRPDDAMVDAAARLFDGQKTDIKATPDPATPVVDKPAETPEENAAREAAETPEQKAAREAEEAKADKRYGAPEGDYVLAMPEGVTLDAAGAKELTDAARELNLSPESTQKLADIAVAKAKRDAETGAAQLEAVRVGWREATTNDKEFGGDKLSESLVVAQKALKQFGSPELNELVVGASLGDHPEFVRLLYRVGKAVSEAPIVNGGRPVAGDAASVMYPNLSRR